MLLCAISQSLLWTNRWKSYHKTTVEIQALQPTAEQVKRRLCHHHCTPPVLQNLDEFVLPGKWTRTAGQHPEPVSLCSNRAIQWHKQTSVMVGTIQFPAWLETIITLSGKPYCGFRRSKQQSRLSSNNIPRRINKGIWCTFRNDQNHFAWTWVFGEAKMVPEFQQGIAHKMRINKPGCYLMIKTKYIISG